MTCSDPLKQSILDIEYSIYSYRSCCTYLFAVAISEKLSESPRSTTAVKPQLGRVRAYLKSSTRAHVHKLCHGGFSAKYACTQPNVGVSSAVFRSGVFSVKWQLEQKELLSKTCVDAGTTRGLGLLESYLEFCGLV